MVELPALESKTLRLISGAVSLSELDEVRVAALGKQGSVTALLKGLGALPNEERRTAGPLINGLRDRVTAAIAERKAVLEADLLEAELARAAVDLSLPGSPKRRGSVHPTSQVMDELTEIFAEMGFAVAEGPDIEDDWHNFTALNFPPKHAAREMHDTFFLQADEAGERKVLRTHTSPVQVRAMMTQKPPIRLVAPGRVYRNDSDQTHTPVFHQIEGLVIDRDSHMGHLKWTLETFISRFFETADVETRFRPHFFPFTEPSAEMDVRCDRSGGKVKVGKGDSWLEILGCGMVHPNVLENCGIDSGEWQGFAFGLGVDRMAMLKYGIPDLREMFAADTRWLAHYGFSPFDIPNTITS